MISAFLSPLLKYLCGGLAFVSLILGIALHMERVHGRKLERRNTELVELRKADRASYEAAQAKAAANNQAHIQQIEKQQDSINEKTRSDYRRDLDRLRAQSGTPQGSAGGSNAPGVPQAPGGAGSADPLRLPPDKLLRAQEIELQLQYLIDWVNRQSQIDPNKDTQ